MNKTNNALDALCRISIMVMVPVMTMVIFIQIVLRYIFQSPLSWAEEVARYLLISITGFGSALAVRQSEHIALIFVQNRIPEKIRPFVLLIIHCLLIGFFGFCAAVGLRLSVSQWIESTPALQIPMTFPTIMVPLGFAIMILFSLELLIRDFRKVVSKEKTNNGDPGQPLA